MQTSTWLAPVLVALVAAAGGWFGIVIRNSGRLGTSTPRTLWDVSEQLRRETREDLDRVRKELKDEREECDRKIRALGNRIYILEGKSHDPP